MLNRSCSSIASNVMMVECKIQSTVRWLNTIIGSWEDAMQPSKAKQLTDSSAYSGRGMSVIHSRLPSQKSNESAQDMRAA